VANHPADLFTNTPPLRLAEVVWVPILVPEKTPDNSGLFRGFSISIRIMFSSDLLSGEEGTRRYEGTRASKINEQNEPHFAAGIAGRSSANRTRPHLPVPGQLHPGLDFCHPVREPGGRVVRVVVSIMVLVVWALGLVDVVGRCVFPGVPITKRLDPNRV
jgi:hypothetical protein